VEPYGAMMEPYGPTVEPYGPMMEPYWFTAISWELVSGLIAMLFYI
jgi:hypothetical protein